VAYQGVVHAPQFSQRKGYVRKCISGGHTGGRFAEPVTSIHPGDDALAAVTAQVLIEALPPAPGHAPDAPMKGRNLLVFADSRQDAAFFAPFFERTARDQAIRSAMVKALQREANEPLDLQSLCDGVWRALRREGFRLYDRRNPEPMSTTAAKDRLTALVAAEVCGGALRVSLESLGLATVGYEGTPAITRRVAELLPSDRQALAPALVRFLLDLMRHSRAINNLEVIDLTDESIWGESQPSADISWSLTRTNASKRLRTLLPEAGRPNRPIWLMVDQLGLSDSVARDILSAFWEEATRPRHRLLIPGGFGYVLNLAALRFTPAPEGLLWRCQSCGTISQIDLDGACASWRCTGRTVMMPASDRTEMRRRNHYLARYTGTGGKADLLPAIILWNEAMHQVCLDALAALGLELAVKMQPVVVHDPALHFGTAERAAFHHQGQNPRLRHCRPSKGRDIARWPRYLYWS
jgi:hypothetical protein